MTNENSTPLNRFDNNNGATTGCFYLRLGPCNERPCALQVAASKTAQIAEAPTTPCQDGQTLFLSRCRLSSNQQ